jgi:inhibitor of cysteine peptidase
MNRLSIMALGLAMFACLGAAAEASHVSINVNAADNGKTVTLAKKNCLNIRLDMQTGTGYGWNVAANSTPLLKLKSSTTVKTAARPGAAATQEFVFCAVQDGQGTLKLDYRRPWEKNTPPAKTLSMTVKIKK